VRVLYLDCFSGAAGDMFLGALIDVGVLLDDVRGALGSLAVDRDAIWTERVNRAGIDATKFCVRGEALASHAHGGGDDEVDSHRRHDHYHHIHAEHPHRNLAEIYTQIDRSELKPEGRERAKALFERLGEAEAAIHGVPMAEVHLHEVGSLDSIVDIVGSVYAMDTLGIERVVASPLNVGQGSVRSAHGLYPVPAPATLRLLEGAPVYAGTQDGELVTPTGALLVTDYAAEYGPLPAMRVEAVGYGAGARAYPDTPNVLRAVLGQADATGVMRDVVVIETEIDDMSPQIFGILMDRVLEAGALDVYYTPVQMKKNRPGTLLTIIAPPERREALTALVFRETTTIGVRYQPMARECLDRDTVVVETPGGDVRVKVSRRGGEVLNVAPEFDDCIRIATARDLPVKDVQAEALRAFHEGHSGRR
jgi:uncharacterized protein (TIGR00299 family) protein